MIHEDQIIRSRRRSIALEIEKDGRLIIRAPYGVSAEEIDAFVISKQKWIADKQAAAKRRSLSTPAPTWEEGSRIPFLGMMISLCYHNRGELVLEGMDELPAAGHAPASFSFNDDIRLYLPDLRLRSRDFKLNYEVDHESEIKQNKTMLQYWYKNAALSLLRGRTAVYEEKSGLKAKNIKITSAKRKWGSCSSGKDILYSWPLICLSFYEIDYVIVHELTHTIHMDHSRKFYADLARILPDYKAREASLHEHNGILTMIV